MGGGGSSSGEIDYPGYMKDWHGVELIQVSETAQIARNQDPYASASAFNPSSYLSSMNSATSGFEGVINAQLFEAAGAWVAAFNAAIAAIPTAASLSTNIATEVASFTDDQDAERNDVLLPRFKAGMTDVNAVMTSAFVIGQSILEAYGARDVTRYDSSLTEKAFLQEERLKVDRSRIASLAGNSALSAVGMELEAEKALMQLKIDVQKTNIDARRGREETDLEIDSASALWDLNTFQQGANVLASIGSGTAVAGSKGPSRTQSVIGGAAAGAATGAMVSGGNPYGALIGGVIGGIGGLIASG